MKKLIPYLFLALCAQLPAQVQMFFTPDTYSGVENPHDIDSLFYWFAADIGVLDSVGSPIANDDGVGTWPDLSGNGHHVTQATTANRPTWKLNGGPNNRPAISFDGTDDFLASAAHLWESDDLTIFVVMKFGNATRDALETVINRYDFNSEQTNFVFSGETEGNGYKYIWGAVQSSTFNPTTLVQRRSALNQTKHTDYKMISFVNDGDITPTFFVNGTSNGFTGTGSGNGTIKDASPQLSLGVRNYPNTPSSYAQVSVSEIIIYSKALTAGERQSIEAYLNQKYKLY